MARYDTCLNVDTDFILCEFFDGAGGILDPIFSTGEINDIDIIETATATIDQPCVDGSTATTFTITPCDTPSGSFTVDTCIVNVIVPDHRTLTYTFVQAATGTITDSSFTLDILENGAIISTQTLSQTGSFTIVDSLNVQTYRIRQVFTACNSVNTFEYSFLVAAGASATCPTIGSNSMTLVSSIPTGTLYTQSGHKLELQLDSYPDSAILSVIITLTYQDTSGNTQQLIIPYCFYRDKGLVLKCKVADLIVKKKEYECIALYESLCSLVDCTSTVCEDACEILTLLNTKVNEQSCNC